VVVANEEADDEADEEEEEEALVAVVASGVCLVSTMAEMIRNGMTSLTQ
jgi:flavin reductase (DIM6/NTAB) family NADH-FMN oxidoreductase RutF